MAGDDWFRTAPVGFLATDPGGRILAANPTLLEWLGRAWEDLAGAPWAERLLPPAGRVLVRTHLLPLLEAGGRARQITLDLCGADGARLHVLVDADRLPGPEGGQHRFTFTLAKHREAWERDLLAATRRAEDTAEALRELNLDLEQNVARRTAELVRANQDLEGFARTVTHDLRNPLQAILSLAEALDLQAGPGLAPQHRVLLEGIVRAGRSMETLVAALLQMATASDRPLRRARVDLSALAAGLSQELQAAAPWRRAEWDIEPGLAARGDPGLLEVVLRNLLGNAWKYSAGAPVARIAFRGAPRNGRPAWCVRDNGAGFDAARAASLFQPFQRFHPAGEFPGLGIGLATARRILDRHGGWIQAESNPGRGATFTFGLPDDDGPEA
jgi:PAS domain S-box-containing protein